MTDLSAGAVLHHGISHLAWLADHVPSLVRSAQAAHPDLWGAVLGAERARAGQLAGPGATLVLHPGGHAGP